MVMAMALWPPPPTTTFWLMVVAAMVVLVYNCAAAFDAIPTILPLLPMAVATNTIAMLPLTAATQYTMTTAKAGIDEQLILAVDGGRKHCRRCH